MAFTNLSDKIIFVCKDKVDIDGVKAWNCFPVNKGSDKVMETALQWARGYSDKEVKQFEYDNISFDDVTIKELEIRGEGGRAYKVVVNTGKQNFYVDLRESCLMDTINSYGIDAGGKLKGKYIFLQEGSNMKLTLIGSETHKNAVEHEKMKKIKKISNSDLIPGHIYQNVSGEKVVFLGTRYGKVFKVKTIEKGNTARVTHYFTEGKVEKKLIFVKVHLHEKTLKKEIEIILDNNYLFYFKVQSSHTYREDLGDDSTIDCEDIIGKFIELGVAENLKRSRKYKPNSYFHNEMRTSDKELFQETLLYLHLSKSKNIETNQEVLDELTRLIQK